MYEHPWILIRAYLRAQAKLEVHIETAICLGRVLFISGVVNRLRRYRGYDIPPSGSDQSLRDYLRSRSNPSSTNQDKCVCLGIGFQRGHRSTVDCEHSVVSQQSSSPPTTFQGMKYNFKPINSLEFTWVRGAEWESLSTPSISLEFY